ncbi:MAG: HAD hydrolase-like protein [Dehalococcoidales bacterium]|nr:HAD hydrolase-like protein [Dehalococcoidales bacterium]
MSYRQRSGPVNHQPKTKRMRSERKPQYVLAENTISLENIKTVIFDMDGVITSSAKEHAASWKRMFDEYLAQRSERSGEQYAPFDIETDYRLYIDGKPRAEGAKSFLESRGINLPYGNIDDSRDSETVWGLGNRKNQYFQEHIKKFGVNPFPSSVNFVQRMKSKGLKVGIISASRNAR